MQQRVSCSTKNFYHVSCFITYLDSAKKDPQYYTGQDFSTVALLNGKLIAFFPLQQIVYKGYILGNVLQSINDIGNVLPFTNTFDASGNLTSLSYVGPPVGSSGKATTTQTFRYRP